MLELEHYITEYFINISDYKIVSINLKYTRMLIKRVDPLLSLFFET